MLLPFEHQPLEVDVSDRVFGDTLLKQRVRFLSMLASQHPTAGDVNVVIRTRVDLYASVAGAYGERLSGKGLSSYEVVLVADNNSAVDPETGAVLHIRTTETSEQWAALLAADERPLMLQGDWFEMLLNTQEVAVGPMLRRFIEQADQPPFSKFS